MIWIRLHDDSKILKRETKPYWYPDIRIVTISVLRILRCTV